MEADESGPNFLPAAEKTIPESGEEYLNCLGYW